MKQIFRRLLPTDELDVSGRRTACRGLGCQRLNEGKRQEEHRQSDSSHTNLTFRIFHASSKEPELPPEVVRRRRQRFRSHRHYCRFLPSNPTDRQKSPRAEASPAAWLFPLRSPAPTADWTRRCFLSTARWGCVICSGPPRRRGAVEKARIDANSARSELQQHQRDHASLDGSRG